MKKLFVIIATALVCEFAVAQPSCVKDAWMNLQNGKIGPAKKISDECVKTNENSADAWLMHGNVYLRLYDYDQQRLKKDPKYVSKNPDAILIANESFLKAITLDAHVQPLQTMYDPIQGQNYCAGPLYDMGQAAKKAGNWEKAYEYLNLAAKNLKLDKATSNPTDLGLIYLDLAQISLKMDNKENFKKMLNEGVTVKTPVAVIYTTLYYSYKDEGDTTSCAKVVNAAKKNIADAEIDNAFEIELDYLAMTNQTDKMNKVADKAVKKYAKNPAVITMVANYLINSLEFEKADTLLQAGIEASPKDFQLLAMYGYRYLYEATAKYGKLMDDATKAKNWDLRKELDEQRKGVLENALSWCNKAYEINKDDKDNNIRLQQTYVLLLRVQDIPEELKAKVDSYQKKN
ncbi:MAG: hypothetical protein J6W84_01885 [Bacteroidales bacterium]|nr:hypothetical protein [Bacteroidales bacterium]MBQ7489575.1 hypothetical protein [Bacteroidales bacterium]